MTSPPPEGTGFEPTREAAWSRLAAVQPADYARTRNALAGAVTRLGPYLTHGFLDLNEVLAELERRHALPPGHKLVYELGWRAYFRYLWACCGDGILQSLQAGPLPDAAYLRELPADVREARTGLPVIDQAVRTLYAEGHLHNHARMWLASYLVHLRKLHWRSGADWMIGHLLDGDLASNHLSWQWVAGTASRKPYLFNAGNVARYAPRDWHCPGSLLDCSYEQLEDWARHPQAREGSAVGPPVGPGVAEPPCTATPPGPTPLPVRPAQPQALAGREVWLVHPWMLGSDHGCAPPGAWPLAVLPAAFHRRWPWSAQRWDFVLRGLAARAGECWWMEPTDLAALVQAASRVTTLHDPHLDGYLPAGIQQRRLPSAFARRGEAGEADRVPAGQASAGRPSFSRWWTQVTQGARSLQDLLGGPPVASVG